MGCLRRYGCEGNVVVRIDASGEIYTRVDDAIGSVPIRHVEDDDA